MLEWLKTRYQAFKTEALEDLASELRAHEDEAFSEAFAAAAAFIACSDGEASEVERAKMLGTLRNAPELAGVKVDTLTKLFDEHVRAFQDNATEAAEDALDEVVSAIETAEQRRLLMRSVLAVAAADGKISDPEKDALQQLCVALGVDADSLVERDGPETEG